MSKGTNASVTQGQVSEMSGAKQYGGIGFLQSQKIIYNPSYSFQGVCYFLHETLTDKAVV